MHVCVCMFACMSMTSEQANGKRNRFHKLERTCIHTYAHIILLMQVNYYYA